MRIIKNIKDLNILTRSAVFNDIVNNYINKVFYSYYNKDNINYIKPNLSNICKIIVFEKGDNPRNLEELGFKPQVEGYISKYPIDGKLIEGFIYHMVLEEDDQRIDVISFKDTLDMGIELFLEEQVLVFDR